MGERIAGVHAVMVVSSPAHLQIAQQKTYLHLRNLEFIRAELYRGLDSETTEPPNIEALSHRMDETIEKLSESYNEYFGSLFQDGSKHSFFGMQVRPSTCALP